MKSKYLQFLQIKVILLLFVSQFSFGQLTNFTLSVTKTDETCTGNGTLAFSTSGTTSGSTILYSVYLLPNVSTPLVVLPNNTITGLTSGNYRVVALESLGSLSNTQQVDVIILNLIAPLNYQIIGQPVSCGSLGSITVNVTQGNPVSYEIISGPVLVASQVSNVFSNLPLGQYDVRVNDACGDALVRTFTVLQAQSQSTYIVDNFKLNCVLIDCNTANVSFWISPITSLEVINYPLFVTFTILPPTGGAPIIINQTVNSGNSLLQIVSEAIPFYYGVNYSCNIIVKDPCGNVVGISNNQIEETLSMGLTPQGPLDCFKAIHIGYCLFVLPITVTFLSAPVGFDPHLFNNNNLGPFFSNTITYSANAINDMPDGEYIIKITDACGNSDQDTITLENSSTDSLVIGAEDVCSHDSIINIPYLGIPIVTVIITSAPPEFNHPIPYDASAYIVNEHVEITLVPGTYIFTGVNTCGRVYGFTVVVLPSHIPRLELFGDNAIGCLPYSGSINVIYTCDPLPNGPDYLDGGPFLVSAIITNAPTNFNQVIPYDVTSQINIATGLDPSHSVINGFISSINLTGLPIGDYTFHFVDNCGNVYDRTVNVPLLISQEPITFEFVKGCDEGYGSIAIRSPNNGFQTVIITSAPSNFSQLLPYDVSFNAIPNNVFYMNSLPEGTYTFYTKDVCGVEKTTEIVIPGYHVLIDQTEVHGNCGSFDLYLKHIVNVLYEDSFWLQKFDPITNTWKHPISGITYLDGAIPSVSDSVLLNNIATNYNIAAYGTFRILKVFYVYSNGNWNSTNCIKTIKEFDFTGELKIISATTLPCPTSGSQVVLNVTGIDPFTFKITTRNGLPFLVNNGNSNIFSGLTTAIYNFQVQDLCGNIVNRLFDIASLPEPSITSSNLCNGQNGQLSVQPFSYLSYQWWKGNDTATILSTTNVLNFASFSNVATPGIYYVRIYSTTSLSCIDRIISYTVPNSINPNAGLDSVTTICGSSGTINLFTLLSGIHDSNGVWDEITISGMLSGNSWLPIGIAYGTYQFRYKVNGFCSDTDEAIITINFKEIPPIPNITVNQNICVGDSIDFNVGNIPNAAYQWTGPNGFSTNLQNPSIANSTLNDNGQYNVKVIVDGCESNSSVNINLNPYPNFDLNYACTNGIQKVLVTPVQNSFDPNNVTYYWTGPQDFTSSSNPISISNSNFGTYNVTVTNPFSCSFAKSIEIKDTCPIPNLLTPNNDGDLDFLDLSNYNISRIEIYSRWGRMVYNKDNYTNQWYGQNNNDGLLPDGTYFYIIQFKTGDNKTGWIYLIK